MAEPARLDGFMSLWCGGGEGGTIELFLYSQDRFIVAKAEMSKEAFLTALCQHGSASCHIVSWPQEVNNG